MEYIYLVIQARQESLRQCALCTYIGDARLPPYQRLSFVPAMLFFTMGFRDILDALRDDHDSSDIQQSVHQHCDEDAPHWRWYLEDLTVIDHGRRLLDIPAAQAFTEVWAPANQATREAVYHTVFLAKTYRTPFLRLVIIEALQATFACFNEPVFRLLGQMGMSEQLRYFGQVHQRTQAGHAGDQEGGAASYVPDHHEREAAVFLVHEVFDVVERMFECWYQARERDGLVQLAA